MAAHEHINPDQLRSLASQHGQKYFKGFDNPETRRTSSCYDYSEHFSSHCGPAKVLPYEVGDEGTAHAANVVPTTGGEYIVDFTYNQFDPKAKVPVVEPRSQYERRFGRAKAGQPYKYEGNVELG